MAKLLGLGKVLIVLLLLQGVHGDAVTVFSSAGGAVSLPCANVIIGYPNCSSTTWIYNSGTQAAVEEVALGKIQPESTPRAERLSLVSNCPLSTLLMSPLKMLDFTAVDSGQVMELYMERMLAFISQFYRTVPIDLVGSSDPAVPNSSSPRSTPSAALGYRRTLGCWVAMVITVKNFPLTPLSSSHRECETQSRDTVEAEEMAKLLGLGQVLTVLLLLQGVHGDESTVFSSAGGAVTLPCANVIIGSPDCSSTTWLYSSGRQAAVEEVTLGKIQPKNTHRAERLSLLPNCSLHITDVSTEDAGYYICQQYPNGGNKSEEDARIRLSVLQVSASPRQAEMATGSSVTLHCQLHTNDNCGASVRGVSLRWVDERGKDLKNTTNRQIRNISVCNSLTVELIAPNSSHPNRTWRCNMATGGQVKASANYTIRLEDSPHRPGGLFRPSCSRLFISQINPISRSGLQENTGMLVITVKLNTPLCETHSRDTVAQRAEEMAKLHNTTLGQLLSVLLLLQGVHGDAVTVFSSAGGAVTLPCANVIIGYPNCSSTKWLYIKDTQATVEEVVLGKIKPENTHRAERLSLVSNCSLHITDVSTEDAGYYICQQYPNGGNKSEEDARIRLSVLQVSASPRQAEMATGSSVALHCQLHTYDNCGASVRGVSLRWVNEEGKALKNTTNRQLRNISVCNISLTVELTATKPSHPYRTWRCNLATGGQVKASANYTIRLKGGSQDKPNTSTCSPGGLFKPSCSQTPRLFISQINPISRSGLQENTGMLGRYGDHS
ncbi:hypothetical protein ACEWY4_022248 [Coilia grayii]|uniref:Ig-like domain-containing protein n=1 Tax=Coilia grayii TaxID=363190 RepID=A0ABD1J5G7_9TELE